MALALNLALSLALALAGCAPGGGAPGGGQASSSAAEGAARAGVEDAAGRPPYVGPVAAPAGEGFYRPPAPLPAGRPGDVLWSRPVPAAGSFATAGARVTQVLYLSAGALGRPIAVSGTVLVPAHPAGDAPILGYAPGTQGLGDDCAASKGLAVGVNLAVGAITQALARGWIVAVPDYEGLGTPGEHTYVVGPAEGHALLDIVRATPRVVGVAAAVPRRVGLTGYSQGGGAAVWAAQLAPAYAPDLDLRGVAAGGVPADLVAVGRALDGRGAAGLGLAAAVGLDAAYPELRLDALLTASGRGVFAAVRTACSLALVTGFAGRRIADLTTADPMTLPRWRARLAENTLGRVAPRVPAYLYHATSDSLVAFDQAARLRTQYCARRVAVTWAPFPGDHIDGVGRTQDALRFLADRFAGLPTRGNC
ncbi:MULTISPECIES: lipase family protein [Frankia]|uniref:Lipase (Partial match) n=1 Tax=Frankia alni (strain DSM 45986 / CECT 9034 / ACN14a) TaxID=326424 RepID=Q0RFZ5_FRAAA|nr:MULTISPECIES: lipase family protein [Frankia]CAJ63594.1 Lipase (partial match) [Frankia alni ACN14a]